jgi:hypothetical protein
VALERTYQLEEVADITEFVSLGEVGEREALVFLEEPAGDLAISVRLPPLPSGGFDLQDEGARDTLCQVVEGVSHFVCLSHRATSGRKTSHLELELQAEVDKYVVIAGLLPNLNVSASTKLRELIYESVTFLHPPSSDCGQRYRLANAVAHRFTRRLERDFLASERIMELRKELRVFFRAGQQEKLRMGDHI